MSEGLVMERELMDIKRINVSSKRQITIPNKFFEQLGVGKEVQCYVKDGSLIIKPIRNDSGEFSEEILEDLVNQGYCGTELIEKFKEASRKVRPAVETLITKADKVALNLNGTGDEKFKEIFKREN